MHDVEADIHYFKDSKDGKAATIEDIASNNVHFMDTRRVLIRNIRDEVDKFSLDKHGFMYVHHDLPMDQICGEESIKSKHYPEMERFIQELMGAKKVLMYNHLVRNAPWKEEYNSGTTGKGPAKRPHVDVSKNWAPTIVKGQLFLNGQKDEIPEVMAGRWQLLNIWRPLNVVQKNPLAVTDSSTVPWSDQHILVYERPTSQGKMTVENCFTKASQTDEHKWYYLHEQKPHEVLLFKIADSDENAVAGGVTHTSFLDPKTEQLPTRESIEMRCIVVY